MKKKQQGDSVNVLQKLVEAVKNGSRELSEFIQDAQGTQAFEREIDEAKERLQRAKGELTQLLAKQKQAENVFDIVVEKIIDHEQLIRDAMSADDEKLALSLASQVVELEKDLAAQQVIVASYNEHVSQLKHHMENSERALKDYERQLNIVKTTENIQKATAVIKENYATEDKVFLSAKQSLARIKAKQGGHKELSHQSEVAEKNAKQGLARSLNNESISAAEKVLERLKQKK